MKQTEMTIPVGCYNGDLQFTVWLDGTPRINLSIDYMAKFLVEINAAVEADRTGENANHDATANGSLLCDAKTYTSGVEAAYRSMWHKYC